VASHKCTRCQLMLCFHCHRSHGNCHVTAGSEVKVMAADPSLEGGEVQQLVAKGRGKCGC
jgi:hypothetical protein